MVENVPSLVVSEYLAIVVCMCGARSMVPLILRLYSYYYMYVWLTVERS